MTPTRSHLSVTLSVWRALFLRESLSRIFSGHAAAFWLLAEPIAHIAFLVTVFTVFRVNTIGGIDTMIWVVMGLVTYFFFTRTSEQVAESVKANQALFTYRQVMPIDSALVRAGLEGVLMTMILTAVILGLLFFGMGALPVNPVLMFAAIFGVWLIGLGWGLIASVVDHVAPTLGRTLKLLNRPLYMISGVIFPVAMIAEPYRQWLLWNPLVHGLELSRASFSTYYHIPADVSLTYLYEVAVAMLFMGLLLHRRYATRLVTQ